MSALEGAATSARLSGDGAISHSRLVRVRDAQRPALRVLMFAALALYGALRWGTLMRPAPGLRLVGLCALAVAFFALGSFPLPRPLGELRARARAHPLVRFALSGWRLWLLVALSLVVALAAVLALAGVPVPWLYHVRVAVISQGISSGLTALPGTLVPYLGINAWVRIVIVLGAGLLLVGAALVGVVPNRLPAELRQACAAAMLTALAVIPPTIIHPQVPYIQGLLLFVLLAGFLWGERISSRRSGTALGVVAAAGVLAALLAPALHERHSWFNYQNLTNALAPSHLDRFNWSQRYGPYVWPRHNRQVLVVKAPRADYWKAQNLDVFDGFGWEQGSGPVTPAPPEPAVSAVKRWSQTITVTVSAIRTTNVIAAGTAARPNHLGAVIPGQTGGTWLTSAPLRPGATYTVKTYSPRPSPAQLTAVPASAYPDSALADYRVTALPASPLTHYNLPELDFPPFHSGQPVLNLASPYGTNGVAILRGSPYARAYSLAQSLATSSATPYGFVAAVQRYLSPANGFAYDEHTALSRFPLLTFLFSTKRGYCQHFAGAMALLVRMGGLPARVVTGFAPGIYNSALGAYAITDRDAHAWVEVWFPRYGWVRFDPTPPSAPRDRRLERQRRGGSALLQGASQLPRAGRAKRQPSGSCGAGRGREDSSLVLEVVLGLALHLARGRGCLRMATHHHLRAADG